MPDITQGYAWDYPLSIMSFEIMSFAILYSLDSLFMSYGTISLDWIIKQFYPCVVKYPGWHNIIHLIYMAPIVGL